MDFLKKLSALAIVWLVTATGMEQAHAQATAQPPAPTEALLVKRAADLRDGPTATARSIAVLPAQTPVVRLPARQGAWMQVKTDSGQIGWVHMFDIGTAAPQSTAASTATGALRGLTNFFNRGSGQSGANTAATSTIGIRGLGAEDIANAQPNLAALSQADALRMDAAQARKFAAEAPLTARSADLLPEPAPPAPPTPAQSNVIQGK